MIDMPNYFSDADAKAFLEHKSEQDSEALADAIAIAVSERAPADYPKTTARKLLAKLVTLDASGRVVPKDAACREGIRQHVPWFLKGPQGLPPPPPPLPENASDEQRAARCAELFRQQGLTLHGLGDAPEDAAMATLGRMLGGGA